MTLSPASLAFGSQAVGTTGASQASTLTNSGTGPLNRRRFAALPSILRRKCAFGNDVLAGTEISQRLLSAEWTITAPRGSMVLFDTKGFHRGGMVNRGERLVLTCILG